MGRVAERRRARLRRDDRLDWRDPNMPVIREYVIRDDDKLIERGIELASPELTTAEAREGLRLQARKPREFSSWNRDPSYHWAAITKYVRENPDEDEDSSDGVP